MKSTEETNILEQIASNPALFALVLEGTKNPRERYICNLILKSIDIRARRNDPWEYKSLIEYGEEEFVRGGSFRAMYGMDGDHPRAWHGQAAKALAQEVTRSLIYEDDEGLVVYVFDDSKYRPARRGDAPYDFVKQLSTDGNLWDIAIDKPPSWSQELFVCKHNLEAYACAWYDSVELSDPLYAAKKKVRRESVWLETLRREGVEPFVNLVIPTPDTWSSMFVAPPATVDHYIDPSDLPEELSIANIAYRAVSNGYGDPAATFRNRLIAYLETECQLLPEAVQRISTVANPDKSTGRKKREKE